MPIHLSWQEAALRLICALVAGGLIGINRSERGRPAGMRTTLLVCAAAALTMIQVNLLMDTRGRPSDSFVQFDVLRLPLGLLSGMGFIGAGTILRRDNIVQGVTTAATLWFVTILGLCFGGGQIGLGAAGVVIGLSVLWLLEWLERRLKEDRRATLTLTADQTGPDSEQIHSLLRTAGFRVDSCGVSYLNSGQHREFRWVLNWHGHMTDPGPPPILAELAKLPGVVSLDWTP